MKERKRTMEQINNEHNQSGQGASAFAQTYFHGTKADLKVGDLIDVGFNSNYGERKNAKYIFLSATLDAAIWKGHPIEQVKGMKDALERLKEQGIISLND